MHPALPLPLVPPLPLPQQQAAPPHWVRPGRRRRSVPARDPQMSLPGAAGSAARQAAVAVRSVPPRPPPPHPAGDT
jgi:hypothetical protein